MAAPKHFRECFPPLPEQQAESKEEKNSRLEERREIAALTLLALTLVLLTNAVLAADTPSPTPEPTPTPGASYAPNRVQVEGGYIYQANWAVVAAPDHWIAFYGNATPQGNGTFNSSMEAEYNRSDPYALPPRTHLIDAYYDPPCIREYDYLFFTPSPRTNLSVLAAATIEELNNATGLDNTSSESAEVIFANRTSFVIGNIIYDVQGVLYANLSPKGESKFLVYALKDNYTQDLVFAVPLVFPASNSFDENNSINYEVILPRSPVYYAHASRWLCKTIEIGGEFVATPQPTVAPEEVKITPQPVEETKTATVQISETSQATIEVGGGQTMLTASYEVQEDGELEITAEFPFPAVYLETGMAEVTLEKAGGQANVAAEKQLLLAGEKYVVEDFGRDMTRVRWLVDVKKGDVYKATAKIKEELSLSSVSLVKVYARKTEKKGEWLPSPAQPQRQFEIYMQTIAQAGISAIGLIASIALLLLSYAYFKKRWVFHYLKANRLGYLYRFFVHQRLHRHY